MKKSMLFIAIILTNFCSHAQSEAGRRKIQPDKKTYRFKDVGLIKLSKTNPELTKRKKTEGKMAVYGAFNFQGTFDYAVPLTKATDDIAYYPIDKVNGKTLSFVFNAVDLRNYIDGSESSYLEIRLAEDSITKDIYLLLVLQDGLGGHIYLQDPTDNSCSIFGCRATVPPGLTTDVTSSGGSAIVGGTYYTFRPADEAKKWIDKYYAYANPGKPVQKKATHTWTYSPEIISDYLSNASEAEYVQFIFCLDKANRLTFVIDGIDENYNHLHFSQNGHESILENCDPCPTCEDQPFENCD